MALIDALIDKMEGKYRGGLIPHELTLSRKEVWALKSEYEELRRITESTEDHGVTVIKKAGVPNAAEDLLTAFNEMRDILDTVYNRLPNGPEWELLKKRIQPLLK